MIPVDQSLRIFANVTPIKLNEGKALKFLLKHKTMIHSMELGHPNITQIGLFQAQN